MAEPASTTELTPAKPDLHVVSKNDNPLPTAGITDAASPLPTQEPPMGTVIPAPESKTGPEPFSDHGYSKDVLEAPTPTTEPKPVGPEAMPPAKPPEGQRSTLDATVAPTPQAEDGRSEQEIAAAKVALDKHMAESNAASPTPFSEHGYSNEVLKEEKHEPTHQAGGTMPAVPEQAPSPNPDQVQKTQANATTPASEAKPALQKSFLQKLAFWKK